MLHKLNHWLSAVLRPKEVLGIDLELNGSAEPSVRCVRLSLSNGVVTVKDKWSARGLAKLQEEYRVMPPIALAFNGRGVLNKQVVPHHPDQPLDTALLARLLPALNTDEFYVQQYRTPISGFFSIARQEVVDGLLGDIQRLGGKVTSLSFGPFSFEGIWPYLKAGDEAEQQVRAGDFQLKMDGTDIVDVQVQAPTLGQDNGKQVKVGEDALEEEFLIAYAAAFAVLVDATPSLTLPCGPIVASQAEWRQERIYKLGGVVSLSFFFVLLLCNFWFYENLSDTNNRLHEQLSTEQNSLGRLNDLERKSKETLDFLKTTGFLGTARQSFFADRLANTLPVGIRLTKLGINPPDEKRIKQEGKLLFANAAIAVQGVCRDPVELNNWMRELRALDWVETLERQNYTFDEAKGEGSFSFYMHLKN